MKRKFVLGSQDVATLRTFVQRHDYSGMLRIVTPDVFRRGLHDPTTRKILLRVERDLLREAERLLRKGDFKAAQKLLDRVSRFGGTLRPRAQELIKAAPKRAARRRFLAPRRGRKKAKKKRQPIKPKKLVKKAKGKAKPKKIAKKAKTTRQRQAKPLTRAERRGSTAEIERQHAPLQSRDAFVGVVYAPGPPRAGEERRQRAEIERTGATPPERRGKEKKQDTEVLHRTPHMDLSPDAPLEAGAAFEVHVSVDTKAPRPGEESEEVTLKGPLSQEEFPVQVTLIASGHFQVLKDSTKVMTILRSTDSAPVVFTVRCVERFPAEQNAALSALFTYEGRPGGRVTRSFRVENGKLISVHVPPGRKPLPTLVPKVAVTTGLDAYDLTISVLDTGENDGRHFHLIADAPAIGKHLETTWNLSEQTNQIVSNHMKRFVAEGLKPTTRLAELKGAGVNLFRATPKKFQKLFWEMIDAGKPPKTIMVISDEPYIPWELMVPRRTLRGKVDTHKPLGVKFSVGRWIRGDYTSPPQQISLDRTYVIAPHYVIASKNLKWAPKEAKFVCTNFKPSLAIDPADLDKITATLREHGATLLHFICHGAASASKEQTVYLRDMVNNLSCSVVEGSDDFVTTIFREHTFVFLNACEVGRTRPALVGINGLPVTFLRLGASGVVAPLWSVKDNLAHEIAEKFYRTLIQKPQTPFADILRDIRSQAYSSSAEDTYAAYCFYGSPLARRRL